MQAAKNGKACHTCVKELSELFSAYITTQSKGNKPLMSHYPTALLLPHLSR